MLLTVWTSAFWFMRNTTRRGCPWYDAYINGVHPEWLPISISIGKFVTLSMMNSRSPTLAAVWQSNVGTLSVCSTEFPTHWVRARVYIKEFNFGTELLSQEIEVSPLLFIPLTNKVLAIQRWINDQRLKFTCPKWKSNP